MYIKRILWGVALLGLVIMGVFSYYVYKTVLVPNTTFEQETAQVFIATNSSMKDVLEVMEPLVKDVHSLEIVADQKKYSSNIRPDRKSTRLNSSHVAISYA